MKSRLSPVLSANNQQQMMVVSITLPSHALAAPIIQQNSQREIVALDNNTLAPLASQAVTKLFFSMRAGKGKELNHEPSPSIISTEASSPRPASSAVSEEISFLQYAGL